MSKPGTNLARSSETFIMPHVKWWKGPWKKVALGGFPKLRLSAASEGFHASFCKLCKTARHTSVASSQRAIQAGGTSLGYTEGLQVLDGSLPLFDREYLHYSGA